MLQGHHSRNRVYTLRKDFLITQSLSFATVRPMIQFASWIIEGSCWNQREWITVVQQASWLIRVIPIDSKGPYEAYPHIEALFWGAVTENWSVLILSMLWMKDLSFEGWKGKVPSLKLTASFHLKMNWMVEKKGVKKKLIQQIFSHMLEHIHHGSFKIYPAQNICIFWVAKRSTWPEVFHRFGAQAFRTSQWEFHSKNRSFGGKWWENSEQLKGCWQRFFLCFSCFFGCWEAAKLRTTWNLGYIDIFCSGFKELMRK